MKNKDIKRMLIEKTEQDIPDVLSHINLDAIAIEPKPEKTHQPFPFKHAMSMTFAVIIIVFGFFFGYTMINAPSSNTSTTPLESETEEITFQTISATSLLYTETTETLSYHESSTSILELDDDDDDDETFNLLESEIDIINQYMNMLESTIGNKTQMIYEQGPSDREGYETMVTYKSTNLLGNLVQYTLHLNIETTDENQTFTGIMMMGEKEYDVTGETKTEDGEKETFFTAKIDDDNYVYSETVLEDDEQSYLFEVYKHGELDHESEVELEMDDDEIKAEINVKSKNHTFNLEIEKEHDDNDEPGFQVKFSFENGENEAEGEFRVSVGQNTTGASVYRYHINNQNIERGRSEKGSRQATEDDFRDNDDDDDDEDEDSTQGNPPFGHDDDDDDDEQPGQGSGFPFQDDDDDDEDEQPGQGSSSPFDDEDEDPGEGSQSPFDDDDDGDDEEDNDRNPTNHTGPDIDLNAV